MIGSSIGTDSGTCYLHRNDFVPESRRSAFLRLNLPPVGRCNGRCTGGFTVKATRSLLLIAIFGMLGSMNAISVQSSSDTLVQKSSLCYVCTQYCKTHPNAPRCN